jgi:hypothetical protein
LKKFICERKKYIGTIINTTSSGSSVHATQTASNLHKRRMLFNHNETHPSCHEVIQTLNKKHRLTYHNLKKVIRERKKYIGRLPSKQKLTYHNLKKIVRAQHNCIFAFSAEHKHHMSKDKEHHSFHHRYGEDAMPIKNVDSTSNMACQQVKLVSSGKHKLTYHILKK